ncbi:hypothetical protein [Candidatus Entotheonella palauensis]|uniref:hypothetical protein n=1 Tax=Candidatus Entotheonella palauensis TaxID=93172 RepID=UPI000B7F7976|nr:hypothetical protein [Candidatus Entotheonella palauensis]
MNKHRIVTTVLTLALALIAPGAQSQPTFKAAADWCRVDDPAHFLAERKTLMDQGIRDLSGITCPEMQPASSLPEELMLPLPCGRRMVFRKVRIPLESVLDQFTGAFGSVPKPGDDTLLSTLSSGPWHDGISGSFSVNQDDKAAKADLSDLHARIYYMGKYEVTEPQIAPFHAGLLSDPAKAEEAASDACTDLTAKAAKMRSTSVPPAANLSWYTAVDFTRQWNAWLLQ